ncbi:CvpA family protein [Hydrogenothermus marinus]|uniref:Colicin V production protein n=1 Tax=Hydrogenothermus marinus TaxID=133270 RepID=A0A3M0C243_9AQUI|nr:colicin V production protein [Hydrogenothermus marinus]
MIDLIFILFFFCVLLIGGYKGFFYLVFNFIAGFTGVIFALKFNDILISVLKNYFQTNQIVLKILSFLFIFLFIFSTFMILHRLIDKFLMKKFKILSIADRISGIIAGVLISIFSIYLIYIYSNSNKVIKTLVSNSKIIKSVERLEKGNNPLRNLKL